MSGTAFQEGLTKALRQKPIYVCLILAKVQKKFWWRVRIKQIRLAGAAKSMKISYVNLRFEKDIAHDGVYPGTLRCQGHASLISQLLQILRLAPLASRAR